MLVTATRSGVTLGPNANSAASFKVAKGEDDRWWLPVHLGGTAPAPEEAMKLDAAKPE